MATYGRCRRCNRLRYLRNGYCEDCIGYEQASGTTGRCEHCGKILYSLADRFCPECKSHLQATGQISRYE